ncbi:PT domain-containing protein [Eubacterium xylanophilum]|uniref:PT domain-containing protein n=1 Tax=Eubacterium xylanophilum TaxID=39497 RepID=UPI00047A5CC3|nr:PT domain-containing protein [Eubacterium xylanophilum]
MDFLRKMFALALAVAMCVSCGSEYLSVAEAAVTEVPIGVVDEEPDGDYLSDYYVYEGGYLEFQSSKGPYYMIDYINGKILECSSPAELKACQLSEDGKTLVVTVNGVQLPVDSTYTFDVSRIGHRYYYFDVMETYSVDKYGELSFDTKFGPVYFINYIEGKVLSTTGGDAAIKDIKLSEDGKTLELTVWSDERPEDTKYVFDLSRLEKKDLVEKYKVYSDGIIEFRCSKSPRYLIDYVNGRILECDSSGTPVMKKCQISEDGSSLELLLYCDQVPMDRKFVFDLTSNNAGRPYFEGNASFAPTVAPTKAPTAAPTEEPTAEPTVAPTTEPTVVPTEEPTAEPTIEPTLAPTIAPTEAPVSMMRIVSTEAPTEAPAEISAETPTEVPTSTPAAVATNTPKFVLLGNQLKVQKTSKNHVANTADEVEIKSAKNSSGEVVLKWNEKETENKKVYVYRSTHKNGKYKKVGTINGGVFRDKRAEGGRAYYYKIRIKGQKEYSIPVKVNVKVRKPKIAIKHRKSLKNVRYLEINAKRWDGNRICIYVKKGKSKYRKVKLKSSVINKNKHIYNLAYNRSGIKATLMIYTIQKSGGKNIESPKVYKKVVL